MPKVIGPAFSLTSQKTKEKIIFIIITFKMSSL